MYYTIRHVTRFSYETPITESVMEVRMQPRTEASQRCHRFGLSTTPGSRVLLYQDQDGNAVHHFNIPSRHGRLTVTAEALVEILPTPGLPEHLGPDAWAAIDEMTSTGEHLEWLAPSTFARPSAALEALEAELRLDRTADPLLALRRLNSSMYRVFEYRPKSTRVDSPIDEAIQRRRGVCQDFAHIMITLVRRLGIPCRYVSGYLFHQQDVNERSADGASHAWVEALLPKIGWVGFDPTNDVVAGNRHVRVAVGRDYADVPPTRGVFKGTSAVKSELAVAVSVGSAQPTVTGEALPFVPWMSRDASVPAVDAPASQQQQQQQ
jgi:transglutaminase-like putative cysteine protease